MLNCILLAGVTQSAALRRTAIQTQDLDRVAAVDGQREGDRRLIASSKACDETLTGSKDAGYRGCQNMTFSGRTCRRWTESHNYQPTDFPDKGLGDHNYCRNPDSEATIWCFTTDPTKQWPEWEFCDPIGVPRADKAASALLLERKPVTELVSTSHQGVRRLTPTKDEMRLSPAVNRTEHGSASRSSWIKMPAQSRSKIAAQPSAGSRREAVEALQSPQHAPRSELAMPTTTGADDHPHAANRLGSTVA